VAEGCARARLGQFALARLAAASPLHGLMSRLSRLNMADSNSLVSTVSVDLRYRTGSSRLCLRQAGVFCLHHVQQGTDLFIHEVQLAAQKPLPALERK
jgi:hypothetical protein